MRRLFEGKSKNLQHNECAFGSNFRVMPAAEILLAVAHWYQPRPSTMAVTKTAPKNTFTVFRLICLPNSVVTSTSIRRRSKSAKIKKI